MKIYLEQADCEGLGAFQGEVPKRELHACSGETLLEVLQRAEVLIQASCGGAGICGKCRVQVHYAQETTPKEEELEVSKQRASSNEEGVVSGVQGAVSGVQGVAPDAQGAVPGVQGAVPNSAPNDVLDNAPNRTEQLRSVLACQTLAEEGMCLWLDQPGAQADTKKQTKLGWGVYGTGGGGEEEAVDLEKLLSRFTCDKDLPPDALGLALDLGTTTLAAYLFRLNSKELLAWEGAANPQAAFGADVISRIQACKDGKLDQLQRSVLDCIGHLAQRLCDRAGVPLAKLSHYSIAGNTTMQHILCGISPEGMGTYPFAPQSLFGNEVELPGFSARARLAACVSAYVGGDITAGLVACGVDDLFFSAHSGRLNPKSTDALQILGVNDPSLSASQSPCVLFADLGTNGEMALLTKGELLCCATATGPAFEGANISCGMQALPGAISACSIEEGAFHLSTIAHKPPVGICASGLIDTLAACLKAGLVDETGRILCPDELPPKLASLLCLKDGTPHILLVPDASLTLSQKDIRAVQLAKAAVEAGIQTLLKTAKVSLDELDVFLIGGAFGTHLKVESAAAIGLIPSSLKERVRLVGNCAGAGACAALFSKEAFERMTQLAQAAHYLELSCNTDFSEAYLDAMGFES